MANLQNNAFQAPGFGANKAPQEKPKAIFGMSIDRMDPNNLNRAEVEKNTDSHDTAALQGIPNMNKPAPVGNNPFGNVEAGTNHLRPSDRLDGQKNYNYMFNQANGNAGLGNDPNANPFNNFQGGVGQHYGGSGSEPHNVDDNVEEMGFLESVNELMDATGEKIMSIKDVDPKEMGENMKSGFKSVVKHGKIFAEVAEIGLTKWWKSLDDQDPNTQGVYDFAQEKKKDECGIGIDNIETTYGGTKKLKLNMKYDDKFQSGDNGLNPNSYGIGMGANGAQGYYGVNDYGSYEGTKNMNSFAIPNSFTNGSMSNTPGQNSFGNPQNNMNAPNNFGNSNPAQKSDPFANFGGFNNNNTTTQNQTSNMQGGGFLEFNVGNSGPGNSGQQNANVLQQQNNS